LSFDLVETAYTQNECGQIINRNGHTCDYMPNKTKRT